jgi:RNA polymerase sigma factor (sigma-70 family)
MDESTPWHTRETLLGRVRDPRDENAWQEFCDYYRQYVYNLARRMGLNHHDAEEVLQNVSLNLWKKLPEFDYDPERGRFRGWLCTVTGNEVRMLVRKRNAGLDALDDERKRALRAYLEGVMQSPTADLVEEEWATYIASRAWANIRDRFGETVREAFESLSRGEEARGVAERLDLSVASVHVYRKRVQDALGSEVARLKMELE